LNIERPTSNEKQTSIPEQGTPISVSSSFAIKNSMLEVRCSTFNFSVTLHQSIQRKTRMPGESTPKHENPRGGFGLPVWAT